jgi:hypothetical protein
MENCHARVEPVMGYIVARKTRGLGHLHWEQKLHGWWRSLGVPGIWYMADTFILTEQESLPLALQIAISKTYDQVVWHGTGFPECTLGADISLSLVSYRRKGINPQHEHSIFACISL